MCGLSAIVNLDGRPARADLLHQMNSVIHHRGPDGSGVFCDGCVGFGHTRLSIIDVGERASQPMSRGNSSLIFNGEIYNYLELKSELEAKGYTFGTSSDTEVLLFALIEWGRDALHRLQGMFAFVYHDSDSGEVWAVRDRFGIKPLVFAKSDGRITISSEAKQILASGAVSATLNAGVARRFLAFGELNTGCETFFREIEEVRPGEMVVVNLRRRSVEKVRWYDIGDRIRSVDIPYHEACGLLRERLEASIIRHHRSDVPLGASLSGGVDSSAIVTLSRFLFPSKDFPTLTTFAVEKGFDETEFSRAVAAATGVNPVEIRVDSVRAWDLGFLKEIAYFQDQPIKGGSQYNEYLLFEAAKKLGLTVMLDGQGADEYFGGYGQFWFAAQMELLRSGNLFSFVKGLRANSATMHRSVFREAYMFGMGLLPGRSSFFGRSHFVPSWLRGADTLATPIAPASFRGLSLSQLGVMSLPFQLHSQDRTAMRWSVESRVPFLDHEVVELVLGMPTEYKVGEGYRKRILRDAVPELPASVSSRKEKVGFASPDFTALLKNPNVVRSCLNNIGGGLGEMVEKNALLHRFDSMVAGSVPYDPGVFRVLAFDAWQRAFGMA